MEILELLLQLRFWILGVSSFAIFTVIRRQLTKSVKNVEVVRLLRQIEERSGKILVYCYTTVLENARSEVCKKFSSNFLLTYGRFFESFLG